VRQDKNYILPEDPSVVVKILDLLPVNRGVVMTGRLVQQKESPDILPNSMLRFSEDGHCKIEELISTTTPDRNARVQAIVAVLSGSQSPTVIDFDECDREADFVNFMSALSIAKHFLLKGYLGTINFLFGFQENPRGHCSIYFPGMALDADPKTYSIHFVAIPDELASDFQPVLKFCQEECVEIQKT
jgi:hypothetical protein